jgi:hypothetical protein
MWAEPEQGEEATKGPRDMHVSKNLKARMNIGLRTGPGWASGVRAFPM